MTNARELRSRLKKYLSRIELEIDAEKIFQKDVAEMKLQLEKQGVAINFESSTFTNTDLFGVSSWNITRCEIFSEGINVQGSSLTHTEKGRFESLIEALVTLSHITGLEGIELKTTLAPSVWEGAA